MSTSSQLHRIAALGVVALGLALAPRAAASPEYPAKVGELLSMECPPPCTLCHLDVNGGAGTAEKPFAQSMVDAGLVGEDESKIRPALDALQAADVDSDGDGVSDVVELRASNDPNLAGDAPICGPRYGCGARVEPRGSLDPGALALALLAAVVLLASRRRRR